MVDGSSGGTQLNGTIMAHQMPLAGAVHHITVINRRNQHHRNHHGYRRNPYSDDLILNTGSGQLKIVIPVHLPI